MKQIVFLCVVMIKTLISIGDGVLFLYSFICRKIKKLVLFVQKAGNNFLDLEKQKVLQAKKQTHNTIKRITRLVLSVFRKNVFPNRQSKKSVRKLKTKVVKPLVLQTARPRRGYSLPALPTQRVKKNLRRGYQKIHQAFIAGVAVFLVLLRKPSEFFKKYLQKRKRKKAIALLLKKTKRQKQKSEKRSFFLPLLIKFKYFIAGATFSFFFIFIPLLSVIFLQSLPNPNELALQQAAQTTKILDRNGVLLYQIYATQNRTVVSLNQIPLYLQEGTIAIEDKNFYTDPGFDLSAIIRSAFADVSGKPLQGGSTITQQLIKSTLLTSQVSLTRKLKEAILAFWAQRLYTKQQILQMYFNQVPYGGTAWGIEAAAQTYFGKDVKDLDLAQSAFLAGMPQAPSTYSPYGEYPNLWKQRQTEVLSKMTQQHYITKKQADDATSENLQFQPYQTPIYAPHFVMYVKGLLVEKYGLAMVERGGLTVRTTLDVKTQQMAQQIVTDEVARDTNLNLTNAAALVTTPSNGDILAMVGSHDYNDPNGGAVNVTMSLRQPGSSIKVVTYSAALSHGFTAATIINDSPATFGIPGGTAYSPVNYDSRFHGNVTLRSALANSFNVPAVKTLNQIGIPTMVDLAKAMGITTWGDPSQYGLSITLGSAEVKMTDEATVYGTLANQGQRVDLNPILKVTDYQGNVLEEKNDNDITKTQVLDPGVTYIISSILADNNARTPEFGPNSPLYIPGKTVSVKTGTTNDIRDNWTFGYTPSYLVAVWTGNNDNSPMNNGLVSGITGAAPIWHAIMTSLLQNMPDQPEPIPSDVVTKACGSRVEYFLKGTENTACNFVRPSTSPTPRIH